MDQLQRGFYKHGQMEEDKEGIVRAEAGKMEEEVDDYEGEEGEEFGGLMDFIETRKSKSEENSKIPTSKNNADLGILSRKGTNKVSILFNVYLLLLLLAAF